MKKKSISHSFIVAILVIASSFELCAQSHLITKADSLYFNAQWEPARKVYESILKEKPSSISPLAEFRLGYCYHQLKKYDWALQHYNDAMTHTLSRQLKSQLYSRIARIYSLQNHNDKAMISLDSAILFGYAGLNEMDTLNDFANVRIDTRFKDMRARVFKVVYPCSTNPKLREFDFWIGEWDVYVTGTSSPKIGHSLIQSVA